MNLDHYIEELKTLVNVDCGTRTVAGVETVAGIIETLWQREGWHTERVNLGDKVGPGVFVSNKPQAAQFDVLLVGHLDTVFAPGTVERGRHPSLWPWRIGYEERPAEYLVGDA